MPYKDHERKIEAMRRWRRDKMGKGYGKWLYARRKLRFDDADRFEKAIEKAIEELTLAVAKGNGKHIEAARELLQTALRESMEAEAALGGFSEEDKQQEE